MTKNVVVKIVLRIVVYGSMVLILYFIYAAYELAIFSQYMENIYKAKKLEGKDIQFAIDLFGWPDGGIHHRRYYTTKDGRITHRGPHKGSLVYYADDALTNKVGWHPFGGFSIGFDGNDRITSFDRAFD